MAATKVLWLGMTLALLAVSAGLGASTCQASEEDDSVELVGRVKDRHQDAILAVPGVVGVGVGRASPTGELVIHVFVADEIEQARLQLPSEIEGVPVHIVVSGPFTPR